MTPQIKVVGNRIDLTADFASSSIQIEGSVLEAWEDWQSRYQANVDADGIGALRVIGREMFDWLNQSGWAAKWIEMPGPRRLEIAADAIVAPEQLRLLELPWEILSDKNGLLAEDTIQPFEVWRRAGVQGTPLEPENSDLSLLFMASSPRHVQPELDYEAEEAGILAATDALDLGLFVEESGCPEEVRARSLLGETFDIMHFSCHGDLLSDEMASRTANQGAAPGPNLVMEDIEGEISYVPPGRLAEVWEGTERPKLVFLSACRTAETSASLEGAYTSQLVRSVPTVVGWAGSVLDPDAIVFAEQFYKELAGFRTVHSAVARARREVLSGETKGSHPGFHWHLARVWIGPEGGGALCKPDGSKRHLPQNAGYKGFLDKAKSKSSVASAQTFVGRRRQTQDIVKDFRNNTHLGVCILGMGNIGKSSLAARVANRFPDLKEIVVYDVYDPIGVFKTVVEALPPNVRTSVLDNWLESIRSDSMQLALAVEALLTDYFADKPILLIIDDLEQVLNDPSQGETHCQLSQKDNCADSITSLLISFQRARGASRLLLTSRYDFEAHDKNGYDLAKELLPVRLPAFSPRERVKQWRAGLNVRLRSPDSSVRIATSKALEDPNFALLKAEIQNLSEGNPGVQDLFASPLLCGEFVPVRAALIDMHDYLSNTDDVPDDESLAFEVVRRMTLTKYREALTDTEAMTLRAASIFGDANWPRNMIADLAQAALDRYQMTPVPVPAEALDAAAASVGVGNAEKARNRIIGLNLLDVYSESQTGKTHPEYLVNRFARPVVEPLQDKERQEIAFAVMPTLQSIWSNDGEQWPSDGRAVEALRIALNAEQGE